MSQRCVVLVGMMGSGKSSVGENLAEMLGYDFVDTDKLIEKQAGKKIAEIFASEGESAFRAMESAVIASLRGERSKVIATGGGAVLDEENWIAFKEIGQVVYLKATARELYQRVKNDTARPLLQAEDPKGTVARILSEREPFYKRAEIIIDTEDLSVEEVTDAVVDELAKRTVGDG